ncbi:MAG: hypothetical protein AABZ39_09005 [Spirochaetota bacterium]
MGRHVYEIVAKRFQGHDWTRNGDYICGSTSKFAERFIVWEALDTDGCGDFFTTHEDIVSAAWETRHDAESKDDIHSMFSWIRKRLKKERKQYAECAKEYIRFNIC